MAQRYFPGWLLRAFGKEPVVGQQDAAARPTPESAVDTTETEADEDLDEPDVEALLRSTDVVEDDSDANDLKLTERFRDVWWRRIRRFRGDDETAKNRLTAVLDIDPDELAFENTDRFVVTFERDRISRWDSDAAFYADLAVEPTLREWLPNWEALGDRRRTELIAGMQAFLESCPACEAELTPVESVRQSCCSSEVIVVDVTCGSRGARVFSGTYR